MGSVRIRRPQIPSAERRVRIRRKLLIHLAIMADEGIPEGHLTKDEQSAARYLSEKRLAVRTDSGWRVTLGGIAAARKLREEDSAKS